MRVSGFTIVRNALKYNYPVVESIKSILPVCDEFIVSVGDSEDATLELIESIRDPKIKILRGTWDFSAGEEVLGHETNRAFSKCTGDWAFYLQGDEVVHESDLPALKRMMLKCIDDPKVDALRFKWLHFFGSYYRYRIDSGWFQKEDRIVKNNEEIESYSGAFGFRRKDGKPLQRAKTGCFIYHYGWVQPADIMTQRRVNAEKIGFTNLSAEERDKDYNYGDLNRFPVYFGTHPAVMKNLVSAHELSNLDWANIKRKYWWSPFLWSRLRYKTFKRARQKII